MLSDSEREFCNRIPVARLATADAQGVPHAVPICFALIDDALYIAIDGKPKGGVRQLKRLRNIAENNRVAVIVDRYDEDWSQLGWVMLRGAAEILENGAEYTAAHNALKERYPPYREMDLDGLPVIAMRVEKVTSWGRLG